MTPEERQAADIDAPSGDRLRVHEGVIDGAVMALCRVERIAARAVIETQGDRDTCWPQGAVTARPKTLRDRVVVGLVRRGTRSPAGVGRSLPVTGRYPLDPIGCYGSQRERDAADETSPDVLWS